jgi:hypothetical protein
MGEYFTWVNPKRREHIDIEGNVFDDAGFLFGVACCQPCLTTDAACTLVGSLWHGNPVLFMGDYWPYERRGAQHPLTRLFDGHPYVDALDHFKNVTGVFPQARGKVYPDYQHAGDSEIPEVPYDGPFDVEVKHQRYFVNRTRHEYVDRDLAPLWYVFWDEGTGYGNKRLDPMPALYCPGRIGDEWRGRWCTDVVDASNEQPPAGYRNVSAEACEDTGRIDGATVTLGDSEVRAILDSPGFERALRVRGIVSAEGKSAVLTGALDVIAELVEG